MTTTAEFGQLLEAFTAAYEEMTALTNARAEKLGIDPTVTPVPFDSSHEELVIAHSKYEDAWQKVSEAADTLWQKDLITPEQSPKERYREQESYDPYDHEMLANEPNG